jgi:hypothetical protein
VEILNSQEKWPQKVLKFSDVSGKISQLQYDAAYERLSSANSVLMYRSDS